jgi:acylphosphatase
MNQDPMSKDKRSSPMDETVRAHVWVKGRVQGVGFRAHVEYSARQIGGVTGWVRNVGYDTLEAIIEGDKKNVEKLVQFIKDGPRGSRVDDSRVEWEKPTAEFDQFGVRRSM